MENRRNDHASRVDLLLILPTLLLSILGVSLIFSTTSGNLESGILSSGFAVRQSLYVLIGLGLYFVISVLPFWRIVGFAPWFYIFIILSLAAVLIFGDSIRGSARWIDFGFVNYQPSELAKPVMLLFLIWYIKLIGSRIQKLFYWIISLMIVLIPAALVFKQPDFGSMIVLFVLWIAILFASGVRLVHLAALCGLIVLLVPLAWNMLAPYQQSRVLSFLSPGDDPLGSGYHRQQAMIATGSGQIFGRGFGRGTQSQLQFLPEHHTDFVFASLNEQFGFLGGAFTILLYGLLLWRIFYVSIHSYSFQSGLFAVGVGVWILFHVFVNAGMNMGLLPITGIPLPLLSYGGSAVIVMFISLGIVQSIARANEL